jgi:hypothetical protein
MPEHFTRSTVEATVWCMKCGKPTPHRIDDRRRGPCLTCLAKLARQVPKKPVVKACQGELFGQN